jgi:sulfoxide reductase heme-binding subunit YedZ
MPVITVKLPQLPPKWRNASIWALYGLGMLPAVWFFYLGATGGLGVNPIKEFEHLLGTWALRFIIATLAVTPLRDILGINWIRYRRALGLLAFYYVVMHFAVYMILDRGLDLNAIIADIIRRWFITIGMAGLVMLVALAVTSNSASIKKLGKNWQRLHKLMYPIAAAGALHYYLAVKSITLEPLIYIALIAVLLAYRPLAPFITGKGRKKPRPATARAAS